MPVAILSGESANLPVGGTWEMILAVTDEWGLFADETPVITVTAPGGGTATPDVDYWYTGVYRAVYVTAAPGRHTARAVTATEGTVDLTAWATAITTAAAMPTLDDLVGDRTTDFGYLGRNSFTDEQVQDALDAEASAQRDAVSMPAAYPPALRQALLRRVAVNLAKRQLPLAMVQGDAEAGSATAYVPGRDPEVRRLERPYSKLVVG